MKKGLVFGFLFVLLLGSFVAAAKLSTDLPTVPSGQEVVGNVKQASTSLREGLDDAITYEFDVPANLQGFARFLFGLKEDSVSLQLLTMLIAIWLMLAVIIYDVLKFVSFFEGSSLKRILVAMIVTLLMGMTGGIRQGAEIFLGAGDFIDFIYNNAILRFLIAAGIVLAIMVIATKLTSYLDGQKKKIEASQGGREIGMAELFSKMFNKEAKAKIGARQDF